MLGAIARIKNNREFLTKNSREKFEEFLKERKIKEKEYFKNIFYNLFSQAIEVLHFLEVCQELLKEILRMPLKEEKPEINPPRYTSGGMRPQGKAKYYERVSALARLYGVLVVIGSLFWQTLD